MVECRKPEEVIVVTIEDKTDEEYISVDETCSFEDEISIDKDPVAEEEIYIVHDIEEDPDVEKGTFDDRDIRKEQCDVKPKLADQDGDAGEIVMEFDTDEEYVIEEYSYRSEVDGDCEADYSSKKPLNSVESDVVDTEDGLTDEEYYTVEEEIYVDCGEKDENVQILNNYRRV